MKRQDVNRIAKVLIISQHIDFVASVSAQLAKSKQSCKTLMPEELSDASRLRDIDPDVVLIDHNATTKEGFPAYEFIRNVLPDCEVILNVPLNCVTEAARLARLWEVFDYVVMEFMDDTSRIPLLIERATSNLFPSLSEIRGQTKIQYHRVMEELANLREILKSRNSGPVVELLHRHQMKQLPTFYQVESPEQVAVEAYHASLIDLICGRLKRLEDLVQLARPVDQCDDAVTCSNQILVVDDAFVDAEMAKFILEKSGYDVLVANSALAAKQMLEVHSPALLLMDIHLGDANGLTLVRTLRSGDKCSRIPIIVVSSDTRRDLVSAAKTLGVQGFVRKPFDPVLLVEKVKTAMAEAFARRFTNMDSSGLPPKTTEKGPVDWII